MVTGATFRVISLNQDRKEVRVTGEGWEEVFSGKSKLQMWSGKGLVG
jgi:hypothetical protein